MISGESSRISMTVLLDVCRDSDALVFWESSLPIGGRVAIARGGDESMTMMGAVVVWGRVLEDSRNEGNEAGFEPIR